MTRRILSDSVSGPKRLVKVFALRTYKRDKT